MHPLLNRRDLTAQRELAAREPAQAQAPLELGGLASGLASGLAETHRLLRELVREDRARIEQLCVTDREPAQAAMENFPTAGVRRLIVRRAGAGGLYNIAAGTPTPVLAPNEARLGGQVTVSGAGAVVLYLAGDLLTPGGANPLGAGAPQLWLAGNGGSWDLRLGGLLWCGSVIAVAAAGSSVTVAEV